jgi:hypothetical protein
MTAAGAYPTRIDHSGFTLLASPIGGVVLRARIRFPAD